MLKSQQPVGHDAESHTQLPLTHCRPAPQAAWVPHMHEPLLQRSALLMSQVVQLTVDGEPQCWKFDVIVSQVEAELQQPSQPLVASHTHVAAAPVPLHLVPVGQAAPVEPQTQPPLEHRLALVRSHVLQAAPPVAPQWVVSIVVWHWPLPSQQPVGHEVASQTQVPVAPSQRWPAAQAVPPGPHEQAPPTQRSAVMPQLVHELPPVPQPVAGLVSLGVQLEPVQQPSQVCAQPRQAPVGEQVLPGSAPPLVQSTQLPPLVPHCAFDGVTHAVPLQQPLAHEVASQTQLPPTQC